jgi:hypothetical protein
MSLQAASALILGGVFAVSAAQKFRDLQPFKDYLRPLAGRYSGIAARLVVGTEILVLVVLLASVAEKDLAGIAGTSTLVFLTLAVLVYSALLVTGQSSDCHCFGPLSASTKLNPAMRPALFALRTSVLITLSLNVRPVNIRARIIINAATMAALFAGLLFSIIREHQLLRREPHPRVHIHAPLVARLQAHGWWVNGRPRSW